FLTKHVGVWSNLFYYRKKFVVLFLKKYTNSAHGILILLENVLCIKSLEY
ncbi:MAG: hypothetical protein ACI82E_000431, partial [Nonlabens sp.]